MNIKRILISEQEKKSILGLYNDSKTSLNEEEFKLNTDGTYNVKNNQEFSIMGQKLGGNSLKVQIKKGTKIYPEDGKLNFNVYYSPFTSKEISSGNYTCGDTSIVVGSSQQYSQTPPPGGFINTIKSLFCDGNKLKTDKKTSEVINKSKTIKLTLSDEERCVLPNDKKWSYAKQKDRWFASKNNVDWFDITNNKKAVNILTTKCKSIKEFLSFNTNAVVTDDDTMVPPTENNVNSQPVDKQQSQPNTTNNNLAVTNKPLDTEIGI
jgi:hypothetical protein